MPVYIIYKNLCKMDQNINVRAKSEILLSENVEVKSS